MCCDMLVCFPLPKGQKHVQCQQRHKGNIVSSLNPFDTICSQCSYFLLPEPHKNLRGIKWEH